MKEGTKMYDKKPLFLRILVLAMVAVLILGLVISAVYYAI